MKQNKITPLELLRQEKEIVKREVNDSEARLAGHWNYLNENIGTLLFSSAINTAFRKLGLKASKESENKAEKAQSPGIFQSIFGGFMTVSPLIWELVQPMLMGYAMKKVKSLFTRKSKK